ncbi:DUF4132 domain-containing protein [Catenuloplanes indicus]|uniref:DUF4132 domain-containing protein n=1 Tax=Catenuloplanes indicus TaxID=137267 RepID=A0AAE4B191_9ACTN|nr:DUF4132 domain-containing protein [Catenuloplanes indicus]MDQ0371175.1 hypothetical protein [Catenuloplanes indicus]
MGGFPDEDTLLPQSGWRRGHLLRPGGWFTDPPGRVDAAKAAANAAALFDAQRDGALRLLIGRPDDGGLGESGRAALADPATATPAGAAALLAAFVHTRGWRGDDRVADVADHWIVTRGLTFAVTVSAELAGIYTNSHVRAATDHDFAQRQHHHFQGWAELYSIAFSGRIRNRLATAGAGERAAAEAVLTPYRGGNPIQRAMAGFLLPAREDWLAEDVAWLPSAPVPHVIGGLLLPSLRTVAQLDAVIDYVTPWWVLRRPGEVTAVVEGLGAAVLPRLLAWLDDRKWGAEAERKVLQMIAALPSDEAYQALLDRSTEKYVLPALHEAAARFPRRALRLTAASGARPVAELLRGHVNRHRELATTMLPELDGPAAARVGALLTDVDAAADAPADSLPRVLVSPPWADRKNAPKPAVIAGLTADLPAAEAWEPGEREKFLAMKDDYYYFKYNHERADYPAMAERYARGELRYGEESLLFALGPEPLSRPLLADWRPRYVWSAESWLPPIVARHGLAALPAAIRIAQRAPSAAPALLPFTSSELAALMADWFARTKTMRDLAREWLTRHPGVAARALIPAALGKPGVARRAAETALRVLGRADVLAAAAGYGEQATAAIAAALDTDPLDVLPAKIPPLADWIDPETLPRVALRDGTGLLPVDSVRHLLTMLAFTKPDDPYPGIAIAVQLLDPHDLAELGRAVFARWQAAGAPSKDGWALTSLGVTGDDETVRRLAPVIRTWPGEGGHSKAVAGLDVLAAIGTDVALMHLHGIAQKVKFKGLKDRATDKIDEVAASLGLTAEELADRLVPDLGLAADGSMRLDYGPRAFVVGFDEQLKPYVTDGTGKRLKALPKPGARDDAERAAESYARFSALKKDARTIAADQIARLERAMVTGRRWTGAEFRQYFAGHPLLVHIVRRLVWAVYTDGVVSAGFRVAEDRSLSDADDEPTTVADDAVVGLPHPLELGVAVPGWAEVFADYEILQPFAQLGREVYTPSPDDFAAIEGHVVPVGRVLGMEKTGWRRGAPQDAGIQGWMERPLRGDRLAVLDLDPGIVVGLVTEFEEQTLGLLRVVEGANPWSSGVPSVPLDRLDPVTAAELMRDLTLLTAS